MKKRKLAIIILIFLIVINLHLTTSSESKIIKYENETLRITPIFNLCENTDKMFKIERLNYSPEKNKLIFNYTLSIKNNKTNKTENISKTINKYCTAKTGTYNFTNNGNLTINMNYENLNKTNQTRNEIKIKWYFFVNCSEINTNETEDVENNKQKNNTENKSLNETENTTKEIPENQSKKPNINLSDKNNTENKTQKCPNKFSIETNKNIFLEKEKIRMTFKSNHWPENYEIEYGIYTIENKTVKKKLTTKNNNTKTYTFRYIKYPEEPFVIKATMKTPNCTEQKAERIVAVKKTTEIKNPKPSIDFFGKLTNKKLELELIASRSNSSKTTIKINFKNNKSRKVLPEQTIKLENKFSKIETKFSFNTEEKESEIFIEINGLGINKEIKIKNQNQTRNIKKTIEKTAKKNIEEEIKIKTKVENKSNDTKSEKEKTKTLENIRLTFNKTNEITGETTKETIISENKEKTTNISKILALIVIISIIFLIIRVTRTKNKE